MTFSTPLKTGLTALLLLIPATTAPAAQLSYEGVITDAFLDGANPGDTWSWNVTFDVAATAATDIVPLPELSLLDMVGVTSSFLTMGALSYDLTALAHFADVADDGGFVTYDTFGASAINSPLGPHEVLSFGVSHFAPLDTIVDDNLAVALNAFDAASFLPLSNFGLFGRSGYANGSISSFTFTPDPAPVPLPASGLLLLVGLGGSFAFGRRSKR